MKSLTDQLLGRKDSEKSTSHMHLAYLLQSCTYSATTAISLLNLRTETSL